MGALLIPLAAILIMVVPALLVMFLIKVLPEQKMQAHLEERAHNEEMVGEIEPRPSQENTNINWKKVVFITIIHPIALITGGYCARHPPNCNISCPQKQRTLLTTPTDNLEHLIRELSRFRQKNCDIFLPFYAPRTKITCFFADALINCSLLIRAADTYALVGRKPDYTYEERWQIYNSFYLNFLENLCNDKDYRVMLPH